MTPARGRLVAFVELAIVAGGLLLAWSQPWITLSIDGQPTTIGGDAVASGLVAIALTVLALIAALALAGPALRVVLGVLGALLGVSAGLVSLLAITDPSRAIEAAVAERTGLSGQEAVGQLVTEAAGTIWGPVALVFSVLLVGIGVQITTTAARWPVSSRRYTRTRVAAEDAVSGNANPVDAWDALSAGDDPTGSADSAPADGSPAAGASGSTDADR